MKRLLILAPNWLGDAVMALPAIADVRRAGPDLSIAVAARPSIAPLFGMVGDVNEVVTLESGRLNGDVASRKPEATLRKGNFEAALLLPNSFHAALIAARAGIRQRWGYRTQWRGPLLTRGVDPAPSGMHRVDYYQRLGRRSAFPTDRRRRGSICHLTCVTPAREPERCWMGSAHSASRACAGRGTAARSNGLRHRLQTRAGARERRGRVVVVGSATDQTAGVRSRPARRRVSVFNFIGRTDLPGSPACSRIAASPWGTIPRDVP